MHAQHLGSFDYNVVVPGTKKLAFPFHRKLGACLRKEIQSVFAR